MEGAHVKVAEAPGSPSRRKRMWTARDLRPPEVGTGVAATRTLTASRITSTMSFKREGPGIVAAICLGALAGLALVAGAVALLAMPGQAQIPAATVDQIRAADSGM